VLVYYYLILSSSGHHPSKDDSLGAMWEGYWNYSVLYFVWQWYTIICTHTEINFSVVSSAGSVSVWCYFSVV